MDRRFFPSYTWPSDGNDDGTSPGDILSGSSFLLPHPVDAQTSVVHEPFPSSSTLSPVVLGGSAEAKAAAASRIHNLAERRRRERINGHLSTLRRMIPNANKMDKASLLASVIQEIRVLEGKARDVSRGLMVPTEVNHVSVECEQNNEQADEYIPLIKASICCDDQPDLFSEINEAFHGLGLKVLAADMVSLGGRVQSFFLLCRGSSSSDGNVCRGSSNDGNACLNSLMETIKQVLGRAARIDEDGSAAVSSKRRRFFQPHYSDIPF